MKHELQTAKEEEEGQMDCRTESRSRHSEAHSTYWKIWCNTQENMSVSTIISDDENYKAVRGNV